MQKILFIDRDGTLINEPPEDFQVDSLEKLEFMPKVFRYLSRIVNELDYQLVMVTNQDGLGTDSFPEETFWPAHRKMLSAFEGEGIVFDEILIDSSFPSDNSPDRKPKTGLVKHYLKGQYDLAQSFMIGDRNSDMEFAENIGCKGIKLGKDNSENADYIVNNWKEIYDILANQPRKAVVNRQTKETQIKVELNLDGNGKAEIATGLGFFDHMLEQIAKHGAVDLSITAKGDVNTVDEHHTVEDVALTLGKAFLQALGSKKGIERYGFLLPMDDSLAQVAIDFGGRPWLVWNARFKREYIGDMPTELFMHFFKSFSDEAKCNLNIQAEGENEHHKIEAIFKAFAKSIKMAVNQTGEYTIPSTKGSL